MINIYNGILLSHVKEYLAISNNMDRSRRYFAKWNKLEQEKQIPYDFTYMWNLKKQMNQNIKTETDSQIQRTNWWLPEVRRVRDGWNRGRRLGGTNFQLYNKSQGCVVQYREYNQTSGNLLHSTILMLWQPLFYTC